MKLGVGFFFQNLQGRMIFDLIASLSGHRRGSLPPPMKHNKEGNNLPQFACATGLTWEPYLTHHQDSAPRQIPTNPSVRTAKRENPPPLRTQLVEVIKLKKNCKIKKSDKTVYSQPRTQNSPIITYKTRVYSKLRKHHPVPGKKPPRPSHFSGTAALTIKHGYNFF